MNRRDAETQRINEITEKVIGCCIDVHRQLGPGLMESVYERCLCLKLEKEGIKFVHQLGVPVEFEGMKINAGYKLDLLVEDSVVVELKAVESVLPVHRAQLLTYLKLTNLSVGLLVNFNVPALKNGIQRIANNLYEPSASPRLCVEENRATIKDEKQVKQLIPHREPFLFVDRIVEQADGRIVTERTIRDDEPHFAGHYPGAPLMPGVLICEACFQTGAMLLANETPKVRNAGAPPASIKKRTRGYLPHWEKPNGVYFVTFRLADSIPADAREALEYEQKILAYKTDAPHVELSDTKQGRLEHLLSDEFQDVLNAGHGRCDLKDDRCAAVVADTLLKFDGERYDLFAWCVMPNHVHAVFQTRGDHKLSDVLHSWKSYTSKACNKILGRDGVFWMRESFDRLVRDKNEFKKFVKYTLENPAKARLRDWNWVGGSGVEEVAGGAPALRTNADAGEQEQAGGGEEAAAKKPVLTRILEAKFRGMVHPGDTMQIEVNQDEKMGEAYVMSAKVSVVGKNVLRIKFIVAMIALEA